MSENKILPCIVCGKENEPVFKGETEFCNQPYGATSFQSYGQYGSTVWDPMGSGIYLEINICDDCMLELAAQNYIYAVSPPSTHPRVHEPHTYEYWDRNEDYR